MQSAMSLNSPALRWFRSNLRTRLDERGMSQSELAEKIGTKPANISRILSGKEDPSIPRAEKIANAVGSRLSHLLDPPA
jgi:transcriptional regulator with XRE-family HTH domain